MAGLSTERQPVVRNNRANHGISSDNNGCRIFANNKQYGRRRMLEGEETCRNRHAVVGVRGFSSA